MNKTGEKHARRTHRRRGTQRLGAEGQRFDALGAVSFGRDDGAQDFVASGEFRCYASRADGRCIRLEGTHMNPAGQTMYLRIIEKSREARAKTGGTPSHVLVVQS